MTPAAKSTSRKIEDFGFLVAVIIAGLYALGELAIHVSLAKRGSGFPYITVILVLALVLPKTVGRATTGRVWEKLADRFGSGGADAAP